MTVLHFFAHNYTYCVVMGAGRWRGWIALASPERPQGRI